MSEMTQTTHINCCGVAPKVYRRGKGDHCFYGIICPICREEVRARRGDTAVALWNGSMARREKANTKLIDDTETKLEAMTQERDALRRENEQLRKESMALAWLASIHCYQDECCPKQPLSQPLDRGTCINCTIEQARESIKAAQAGKEGAE